MISTALFLSAGLMSSVVIQDVKASREAGHLRVEVAGDGGIDPDEVRFRLDGGMLLLSLPGTRVRENNRSWDLADGAGEIRAHRHKSETELVIPLVGNGCNGPVELQGSDDGITALVGCDGAVAANPNPMAAAEVKQKVKAQKTTETRVANDEGLKALVELPSEPAAAAVAKVETKVEAKAETKPETKVEAKAETKPETKVETKTEEKPAPAKPELLIAPTTNATGTTGTAPSTGSLRSIGMPAALLGILALGAYLFARRRRTISVRHIQILETASLGPKRSLVVARVGEETLILGTSEAGITLLKNGGGMAGLAAGTTMSPTFGELETAIAADTKAKKAAAAEAAEADAAAFEISQPLEEALADIPEPGLPEPGNVEGNNVFPFETRAPARKEGRPGQLLGLKDRLRATASEREDSFEDLLEDSLEDQELRQKLAAGMSARVR